jgi:phosphatidylserine/phosphatidylglycerophosphate/cardiolipin synthase-like enzyme
MRKSALIYLVGFAGCGKLTIARVLAPYVGAKIVDNHWINNPIFGLIDNDRLTPFPAGVWHQVDKVCEAVLETIASLSAPDASFILTHAGYEDDPEDHKIYDAIVRTARRRYAVFVPVRLLCDQTELVQRVASPERAMRLKSMNAENAAREVRLRQVLKVDHPNAMTLDTSTIGPEESARLILAHVERCRSTM